MKLEKEQTVIISVISILTEAKWTEIKRKAGSAEKIAPARTIISYTIDNGRKELACCSEGQRKLHI